MVAAVFDSLVSKIQAKLRMRKFAILFVLCAVIGFAAPERVRIPVAGATVNDWNPETFWYEPWGASGVHKGIDIFAMSGTDVVSATDGIVLYKGSISVGGNVIVVLGPKWRFHYFAHLEEIDTSLLGFVNSGERIGTVGDSGNAKGKQPHLHYSIARLFPVPWEMDGSTQGYKKSVFIDPGEFLGAD